jgi:hypothetical protein
VRLLDEVYIDLTKGMGGRLNTAKLIRRMVMVRGKNGKVFRRMQWVRPWEGSTGHGVRAVHNDADMRQAREDGVHEHPDRARALQHQGMFNADHVHQGMGHENPIFLPETAQSAHAAKARGATNHIPHDAREYNRHEHTNGIHYSHNHADVMPFDDDAVAEDYKPRNEHENHIDMVERERQQAEDRNAVSLPEGWHDMISPELSDYAKEHYPNQPEQFVSKLESAKRERSGGELTSMDDLVLDMVREDLGLVPMDEGIDRGDDEDFPTVGYTRGLANGHTPGQRIRNATPEQAIAEFDESEGRRARSDVLAMTVQMHGDNPEYQQSIDHMRDALGKTAEDVADLSDNTLNGQDRKVKAMVRRRVPNSDSPKNRAIKEKAQPLDIRQIARDNPGPTLNDFYDNALGEDKPKNIALHHEVLDDLFGGLSVQAVQHIMSHPDGKYTAQLTELGIMSSGEGYKAGLSFRLEDANGGYAGSCNRKVHRKKDGTYHVYNDILSIGENQTNLGIATHLYHRSEQMWKHLAGDNRVEIEVFANISVGKYAWADKDKGFDFDGKYERNTMRRQLKDFMQINNWDEKEVMKACGYKSVDDLNHAWQFAELDDGHTYNLTPHNFKDLKGNAHLGKAFLLTHSDSWSGIKYINDDGSVNRQKHLDTLVDEHLSSTGEDNDYELTWI